MNLLIGAGTFPPLVLVLIGGVMVSVWTMSGFDVLWTNRFNLPEVSTWEASLQDKTYNF